uniref:Uncharacterized protein n=1 Tax=Glossina austeni TaxID=7395 RepID=A0A1A9VVP6_GLOAU
MTLGIAVSLQSHYGRYQLSNEIPNVMRWQNGCHSPTYMFVGYNYTWKTKGCKLEKSLLEETLSDMHKYLCVCVGGLFGDLFSTPAASSILNAIALLYPTRCQLSPVIQNWCSWCRFRISFLDVELQTAYRKSRVKKDLM